MTDLHTQETDPFAYPDRNALGTENLWEVNGVLMALIDVRLHYVRVSLGFARVLGCEIASLFGKPIVGNGFTRCQQAVMQRVLESGRVEILRDWTVTRESHTVPTFWNWCVEALPQRDGLLIWAQDVTEQRLLESDVIAAAARERQEVGQDIHDNIGQLLTALSMKAKALEFLLKEEDSDGLPVVRELRELATEAIGGLKQVARRLYPVNVEQGSLISGLRHLTEDAVTMYDVTCQFIAPNHEPTLAPVQGIHIHAIVNQVIHHAVRQAGARALTVTFNEKPDHYQVVVVHDGKVYKRLGKIQGYRLMTFHAHTIGGTVSMMGETGKPVTFTGRFPRKIENHA